MFFALSAIVAACVVPALTAHRTRHHNHAHADHDEQQQPHTHDGIEDAPIPGFLPPVAATVATGGDLAPSFVVQSASECAAACLANSSCISFNLDSSGQPPTRTCGIVGECYAPNVTSCPSFLTLSCVGGVFTSVDFAAYGEPIDNPAPPGACNFSYGSCNADTAAAVFATACLGRTVCTVDAELATFGGTDPCTGQYKFVAAALSGNCTDAPPPPGQLLCTLSGLSRTYALAAGAGANASYWQRLQQRNDTRIAPAVPYALDVPATNVTLAGSGIVAAAFATNVAFLATAPRGSLDDFLFPYRMRHNASARPPGGIWGWDDFVPGSVASMLLMGAGGVLRWTEHAALRALLTGLLQGIADAAEDDGFAVGYAKSDTNSDYNGNNQLPSYVNSWFTHGMLEAAPVDPSGAAMRLARGMNSWWNNNTYLPQLFPQDGGDAHAGPAPNGYDPAAGMTSSEPFAHGHLLYWMNQAGIGHSRMAMSAAGTQADVDFLVNLFQEDWWLDMLAARNNSAIYARKWYPDNYEICVLEAYLDLYALTGNARYLDAVRGGWEMFRDPLAGWMFPGGSVALNENYLYPPGSFPLEFRGSWGVHTRPTGEFCPSAFWIKLNQRFHRLFPGEEAYAWEVERALINVGMAGQTPQGVRYFARLHGVKDRPTNEATCCEGQSARIFGAAPELIFSLGGGGGGSLVTVNLYEAATLTHTLAAGGVTVNVTVATAWPFATRADVLVAPLGGAALAAGALSLSLRIPAWATPASPGAPIPVSLDGASRAQGAPGSYVTVPLPALAPGAAANLSLPLVMAPSALPYTGVTQIAPYARIAYTFGPFLLATVGGWDAALDCGVINGTQAGPGGLDPLQPSAWLEAPAGTPAGALPAAGVFTVRGLAGVALQTYYTIGSDTNFTAYPIVVAAAGAGESA